MRFIPTSSAAKDPNPGVLTEPARQRYGNQALPEKEAKTAKPDGMFTACRTLGRQGSEISTGSLVNGMTPEPLESVALTSLRPIAFTPGAIQPRPFDAHNVSTRIAGHRLPLRRAESLEL
jgi:hypothetical protein